MEYWWDDTNRGEQNTRIKTCPRITSNATHPKIITAIVKCPWSSFQHTSTSKVSYHKAYVWACLGVGLACLSVCPVCQSALSVCLSVCPVCPQCTNISTSLQTIRKDRNGIQERLKLIFLYLRSVTPRHFYAILCRCLEFCSES